MPDVSGLSSADLLSCLTGGQPAPTSDAEASAASAQAASDDAGTLMVEIQESCDAGRLHFGLQTFDIVIFCSSSA